MKRIGILGDIGSGKSYIAKCFGYPVFNADKEVAKIYDKEKKIFFKLKKILPKYINSFYFFLALHHHLFSWLFYRLVHYQNTV